MSPKLNARPIRFCRLLVAAAVFLFFACSPSVADDSHQLPEKPAEHPDASVSPQIHQLDAKSLPKSAEIPILDPGEKGRMDWMALGFGSLWAPAEGYLYRIDPAQKKILSKIKIGPEPYRGIVTGFGSVWVPSAGGDTLFRIDPKSNQVISQIPIPLSNKGGGSEGSIGVGKGSLWVVTGENGTNAGTLNRMDPKTGKTIARIAVDPGSHGVVAEGGGIWVSSASRNTVKKIDPETNQVVGTVRGLNTPRFMATGNGSVWVLNQKDGTVSRIDPKTERVVATIRAETSGQGGDIAVGEGAVWVSADGKPLTRIDPKTNSVTSQFVGDEDGDAVRAGLGYLWYPNGRSIWVLSPKLIR